MFKIFVKNLKLYGYHGVREHEKKEGQYFLFNIEIIIKDSGYTRRDDLENTLSYSDVIREVKKINKSKDFDLLETFTQVLANRIMEMSGLVKKVMVRIEKPSPPIDEELDTVGVEYMLIRDDLKSRDVKDLKFKGDSNPRQNNTLDPSHINIEKLDTGNIKEVYLSLGSNAGDRKANLKKALELLDSNPDINIDIISSLYETEPMYVKDQKSFYNLTAKASIESSMGPFELLGSIKRIEYDLDRKKGGTRYGPRSIDIDILYFGDEKIESEILEIPHPKIGERKFVLLPLSEIAPDIKISGRDIKAYIKEKDLSGKVELISPFDI
ncbi:MAG: 2-amino-4-hydroxy-6-hydroxymethyldihydropteridine diphosphokinase [Actinomycetia bacterium]|nr:2-amino-4-hydroxy-6-hydroxymethyldihydropteridine diphosphokinase [Actinomycetes bacterium]